MDVNLTLVTFFKNKFSVIKFLTKKQKPILVYLNANNDANANADVEKSMSRFLNSSNDLSQILQRSAFLPKNTDAKETRL